MPTRRGRLRRSQAAMLRPEAEVGDGHRVPAGPEGGPDIFEAERLDAEKRAEPEPVIAGMGAKEENVHGFSKVLPG